ncbi:N,N-dimethylformamidase beta subunit family domain-containing protein [Dactylosporangium salmoneum]|uniref:N,N-dimethylformamidase beta subunit-like C-terminal domain-containing protein n=1 Tax=Dactylosporangium salmoneum TaxID=53361 RepID=A0ABP5U9Q0_9ACTN
MSIRAYARATSCAAGGTLEFAVSEPGHVVVADAVSCEVVLRTAVEAPQWTLDVPPDWPSSLYRATFARPGEQPRIDAAGEDEVWFAVRAADPGAASPILVSVPFATWQAYNRAGEPGEGLYYAEQPLRATRVTFDRPGGGPPPERWEEPLLRWLPGAGHPAEYCSNLDLHGGDELLSRYRLLVVCAHDEYWTWEMRDAVESFARRGGNVAVFGANTAWWQMRLEDGGRTMVCHRDAATDPMAAVDPGRVTVEWSSAPVHRPENAMTGVSFRRGAGAWGDGMAVMGREAYTARFADHWVFEGTGLADGDKFGQGTLGYETDAAEVSEVDGVPRATGRDGTPPSFVVLATADLRHWRRYGQGGAATMGVFGLGAGTVFTAATVNWGKGLDDPVVDRITRNVLDRLTASPPAWDVIGPPADLTALAACDDRLFAVAADGALLTREACAQNLPWRSIGRADGVLALAAPREAAGRMWLGLWAVTEQGRLLYRDPTPDRVDWTDVAAVPPGTRAMALCDAGLFAATIGGELLHLPALDLPSDPAEPAPWRAIGDSGGAVALTALSGRLYAMAAGDRLLARPPSTDPATPWTPAGSAPGAGTLAGYAGRLIAAGPETPLRWRSARPAGGRSVVGDVGELAPEQHDEDR